MANNNSTAATHKGTCQVCGSLQKLPKGTLAKHGYTVDWGFFNGVCTGSHHLPFELSCDMIQGSIDRAKTMLAATQNEITDLAVPAPDTDKATVWMQRYRKATFSIKGGYYWDKVELTKSVHTMADGYVSVRFEYATEKGAERVDAYTSEGSYAKTMTDAVQHFNGCYSKVLVARAAKVADYIKWQTERVANWKPTELKSL